MTSPLAIYNQVAEEFKITDEMNVALVSRRNFAKEQAEQMQHIVNRLLFDISMTRIHGESAGDVATKAAYSQKAAQYENDLRQTRDSLEVALALAADFDKELNPEA